MLRIYCVYQCVEAHIGNAGPMTNFTQQWQMLRQSGILIPHPRQQLVQDLQQELEPLEAQGYDLAVVGDFNESIGVIPDMMATVCARCGLTDALGFYHPAEDGTPSYIRGRKRLDYGLLSTTLLSAVSAVGMNRFMELYASDHRALFIDLDLQATLRLSATIVSPALRHISSDSAQAGRFVDLAFAHLEQNAVPR